MAGVKMTIGFMFSLNMIIVGWAFFPECQELYVHLLIVHFKFKWKKRKEQNGVSIVTDHPLPAGYIITIRESETKGE